VTLGHSETPDQYRWREGWRGRSRRGHVHSGTGPPTPPTGRGHAGCHSSCGRDAGSTDRCPELPTTAWRGRKCATNVMAEVDDRLAADGARHGSITSRFNRRWPISGSGFDRHFRRCSSAGWDRTASLVSSAKSGQGRSMHGRHGINRDPPQRCAPATRPSPLQLTPQHTDGPLSTRRPRLCLSPAVQRPQGPTCSRPGTRITRRPPGNPLSVVAPK
jgi:hypothetical protein